VGTMMQTVPPGFQKYRSEFTKIRHFKRKKTSFFSGKGPSPLLIPLSQWTQLLAPKPIFLAPPLRPANSSQICAYEVIGRYITHYPLSRAVSTGRVHVKCGPAPVNTARKRGCSDIVHPCSRPVNTACEHR